MTLDPGVWIHSGVCSLYSLRCLEVGVSPESVVTPEFVVWGYSGVWSLESLRRLQSGVGSHSGFVVWSHSGV